jgi:hypothetical protein
MTSQRVLNVFTTAMEGLGFVAVLVGVWLIAPLAVALIINGALLGGAGFLLELVATPKGNPNGPARPPIR